MAGSMTIKTLQNGGYTVSGLSKLNLVIGRNGCGKSTFLRALDDKKLADFKNVRYVTPERAGSLTFEGGIESAIRTNENWLSGQRKKNQSNNFKQQSVSIFSKLRTNILQLFHDTRSEEYRLEPVMDSINALLDHVEIRLSDNGFGFYSKLNGQAIQPDSVSSGESELTALAIEVLEFVYSNKDEPALILLDEPDVHIHPDLQRRFINFLINSLEGSLCQAIISTHSTTILSASSEYQYSRVCFLDAQQKELEFKSFDQTLKKSIPAFGSHLISRVFRDCPVLLVEGEDDARIWSAASRSSNGIINYFPVVAGDKNELTRLERECSELLPAIYDSPVCFSLRDGDGVEGNLDNVGIVKRLRLSCYAAENLILCDETLTYCETDSEKLKCEIRQWIDSNPKHVRLDDAKSFLTDYQNRKDAKVKPLRELFLTWIKTTKPWEVLVGQVLAKIVTESGYSGTQHSMENYLGENVVESLCLKRIETKQAPEEG